MSKEKKKVVFNIAVIGLSGTEQVSSNVKRYISMHLLIYCGLMQKGFCFNDVFK